MTQPTIIALQAQDLPAAAAGEAPAWIHLLPAGVEIMTQDNRGPYRVVDPQSVVASAAGRKLPIDENHAIDWAAPRGEPSPARGYIVELQARADGIWGRVDWTETGRQMMADRAYLGISPAIVHDGAKQIIGIARASLTNKPNLRGLTALHMETDMSMSAVAKALGLAEDATEAQVLAGIAGLKTPADTAVALQSQIGQIGIALGVAETATGDQVLAAAKAKTTATPAEIIALQSELATTTTRLATMEETAKRDKATTFVDAAIRDGRVGLKPVRDRYIAMHMADPANAEALIGAMPKANGTSIVPAQPVKEGEIALQSEQLAAARALGLDPKTYAAALKAEHEEAL